ncbi:hypothetical protein ACSQ67_005341 [Phaseolus vulgaris]
MFEGLVHQLLLGYLGRYFKDIQKEQLKIRLEEVLLENVEVILDAFDYLQLPFALKQGRVGKLSIKIPWKKPWDPIIIILEDVLISASQRGDQEWSSDAVEKREFAGKKAKLAAAELGKLSRRVVKLGNRSFLMSLQRSVGGGNWSFGYVDGSFNDVDGDGSSTMRMVMGCLTIMMGGSDNYGRVSVGDMGVDDDC